MAIALSPKAAEKVKAMMTAPGQEGATGLRIKVVGGGCSGLSYQMALDREAGKDDKVFESEGVRIYLDPKSALFVGGTVIDYEESMMGQGFAFKNPNAKGTCGCGSSFTA